MRNISIQLNDIQQNNVPGINRNSSSRGSIRISPPIAPNNESKPILRSNTSNIMRSDSEMQSFIQSQNQISGLLATNPSDSGNGMLSHQYYDTNNYLSHVNKCQQMAKNGLTISHGVVNGSGLSSLTPITSVVNNGITSAQTISHSRASLEDHGVDVGRLSPSSSSNDSRKSRYSSASLDSGRGSDAKISGQSHRVSVHSCESLGSSTSNKDNYNRNSSSSSSIGSGNSVGLDSEVNTNNTPTVADHNWTPVSGGHSITGPLSIPEMVLHGIPDEEIIHSWLSRIHFEEYTNNFIRAGYDMPTISRMTPEDLTAIGITKPGKRQFLKTEIQKLSIADGIPNFKPNSLLDWLKLLRLEQYFTTLCAQGYDSIDRVTELAWEDLEEVGINKLGHQKKIMLAIKRIQSLNNNMSRSPNSEVSRNLTLPLVYNNTISSPEMTTRPNPNIHPMPVMSQFQDTVPIKMFAPTKLTPSPTTEKPITPQLKTFQQLPNNGFLFCRQRNDGQCYGQVVNDLQNNVFQSSRGRSLESLDNNENNYYQMYCGKQQQRQAFNGFQKQIHFFDDLSHKRDFDPIHGYETDSEIISSYANSRKNLYEIDGTATLQRPKGLIKTKPIAKIVAKTRQTDSNEVNQQIFLNEPQKTINCFDKRLDSMTQTDKNSLNAYICCDDNQSNCYYPEMSSQLYGTLHRKKPPPPPKRVNSIRSPSAYGTPSMATFSPNHNSVRREGYEDFQEEVFASCVKSLTSRFNNNSPTEMPNRSSNDRADYANDFPPPPSPLSFVECQNYNTLQRRKDTTDRECNISSSSSTESMPFANDNIGTILRANSESIHKELGSPSHSYTSSAPSSMTSSPLSMGPLNVTTHEISNKILDSEFLKRTLSPPKHRNESESHRISTPSGQSVQVLKGRPCVPSTPIDQLDDIETMLVNLSEQLDLMLESESHKKNRNN